MYPGMIGWWKARREAHWAGHGHAHAGCGGGPGGGHDEAHGAHEGWHAGHGHGHGGGDADDDAGGSFGVRRPLRFLAFKLGLNEAQVAELAKVLSDLKMERAQVALDHRRTVAAFADAIAGAAWNADAARDAAGLRVKGAERLRDAVVTALGRLHALLDPAQREKLAYLLRTGTLTM